MTDAVAFLAGSQAFENPHTDPVTVAWSKVDVHAEKAAGSDPEIARMESKVERAKVDLDAAKAALAEAKAAKLARAADHKAAVDELTAAEEADPTLAAWVRDRRNAERSRRRAELEAALAQLEGN